MTAAEGSTMAEDDIVVECELDAAPEKVWRALTIPELAAEWLGASEGTSYRIVEAEPYSRLRYAWNDPATDRPESEVTVELWPGSEGRTGFRLTHAARTIPVPLAANGNSPPAMRLAA